MFDSVVDLNIEKLIEHINKQGETINKLIEAVKNLNSRVEELEKANIAARGGK